MKLSLSTLAGALLLVSIPSRSQAQEAAMDAPPPPPQTPPPSVVIVEPPPPPVAAPALFVPQRPVLNACDNEAWVVRLGAAGGTYRMSDVQASGGGINAMVGGGRCQRWDILADVTYMEALTPGGLNVRVISGTSDFEWQVGGGFRMGAGVGISDVGIQRATTGGWVEGIGPKVLLRIGYDSGLHLRPYVLFDMDGMVANTSTYGGTLRIGIRL